MLKTMIAGTMLALAAFSSAHAGDDHRRNSTPAAAPVVVPVTVPVSVPITMPASRDVAAPASAAAAVESYAGASTSISSSTKAFGLSMGAAANSATCGQPILGGLAVHESAICAWRTACGTLVELNLPDAAKHCACMYEPARLAVEATGHKCRVPVRFFAGPIAPGEATP